MFVIDWNLTRLLGRTYCVRKRKKMVNENLIIAGTLRPKNTWQIFWSKKKIPSMQFLTPKNTSDPHPPCHVYCEYPNPLLEAKWCIATYNDEYLPRDSPTTRCFSIFLRYLCSDCKITRAALLISTAGYYLMRHFAASLLDLLQSLSTIKDDCSVHCPEIFIRLLNFPEENDGP